MQKKNDERISNFYNTEAAICSLMVVISLHFPQNPLRKTL